MSVIKLTLGEVSKTCRLIVSDAHRKLKESLADYHDPSNEHHGDMAYCRDQLNKYAHFGCERLQGLVFLFLGDEKLALLFKKFQDEITEDRKLFGSLLIAGGHYKDEILVDLKEVA